MMTYGGGMYNDEHEDTESLELSDHFYNWELEKAMEAGEDEDELPVDIDE